MQNQSVFGEGLKRSAYRLGYTLGALSVVEALVSGDSSLAVVRCVLLCVWSLAIEILRNAGGDQERG